MEKDKVSTENQLSDVDVIVKAFTHTKEGWSPEEMEDVRNFAYDLVWRIGALPIKKRKLFEDKVRELYKTYENYTDPTLHMAKKDLFAILDEIEAETQGDKTIYKTPEPAAAEPEKQVKAPKPAAKAPKALQTPKPQETQDLFLEDSYFLDADIKEESSEYYDEEYTEDDSLPDLDEFRIIEEPKENEIVKKQQEEQKVKQTQVNTWIKQLRTNFHWDDSNKEHARIVQRAAWGIIDEKIQESDFFGCKSLEELKSLLLEKCGQDALNDKKKK